MKIVLPFLFLLAACAQEPSCTLERLADLRVEMVGNVPVVQAVINGQPASLVLDTGLDVTTLAPAAAERLGVVPGQGTLQRVAAGGAAEGAPGVARTVSLGGLAVSTGVQVVVTDVPPPADGLLGLNVLADYELDLDSAQRRAVLYRARPCPAVAPAWAGQYRALRVGKRPGSSHLFVPVLLDGQPLTGMLDTGASITAISHAAAREARVTPRMIEKAPAARGRSLNPEGVLIRTRRFRSLRIGADELDAPLLAVAEMPPLAGDVLVGSDYLATRRLWISVLLGRVYVQPSGTP